MKTKTVISMLVAGACAFSIQQAQANAISGQINMTGVATLNNQILADATADLGNTSVTVIPLETGSYASVPSGTPVTFSPFTFTSASVSPLWTFTYNTVVYSFDLANDYITVQNATTLDLAGNGTLNVGAASENGSWTFQITSSAGVSSTFQFGFTASNNTVPDGGMTMILLGGAMTAMTVVGSRMRKLK